MHSFITADIPDIKIGPNVLEIHPDKSIGIEEVRDIQHFLSRKATHGANTILVHDAHLLTLPAQNAFLKTLEEPPSNSVIYLITAFPDQLLPTILSRCELLVSLSTPSNMSDTPTLPTGSPADRLRWADAQEFDRASALKYLSDLEYYLHTQITSNSPLPMNYSLVVNTRKYLNANCSVKLTMDIFSLNL